MMEVYQLFRLSIVLLIKPPQRQMLYMQIYGMILLDMLDF